MQIWLAPIAGVAAAVIGAGLSTWFSRSRPLVIPTSLRMSVGVIPQGSVVDPNSDLLAQLRDHPYLDGSPFVGAGKVDERAYVVYLQRTLETAQGYAQVQLPAITVRAQQLQAKLAADDFEGVARIWSADRDQLWSFVEGPYIRREFSLDPLQEPDRAGPSQDGPYDPGKDGETFYLVGRKPPYYQLIFTPVRRAGVMGERSKDIARRLWLAFGSNNKQDLARVFNFLASFADERIAQLDALSREIQAELQRLTRLSVTALISNTGGRPVSISTATCTVTMNLDGYSYVTGDGVDRRRRVRSGPCDLKMLLVDDAGKAIQPLAIEAGGVQPVIAVHRSPLSDEVLDSGGTMYDLVRAAFEGSERTWRVAVEVVVQGNPARTIRSSKIPIRGIDEPDTELVLDERSGAETEISSLGRRVEALEAELSSTLAELLHEAQQSRAPSVLASELPSRQLRDSDGSGSELSQEPSLGHPMVGAATSA